VILTTHDLVDVERLCRRLIVINHGRLIEDGPLDALIDRLAPYRMLVIESDDPNATVTHPEAELVRRDRGRLWLRFDRKRTSASRLIADVSAQVTIRDLSVQEPNLEDVIRHVYGDNSQPRDASGIARRNAP
jgi:ABC-2 type transport system ATP-binding protein